MTMEALSNKPAPTRHDLEQAAVEFFDRMAKDVDQPRQLSIDHFDEDIEFNVEESRRRMAEIDQQLVRSEFDGVILRRATELIASVGNEFGELPLDLRRVALQLTARAERAQLDRLIHLLKKPASSFHSTDELFQVHRLQEHPTLSVFQPIVTGVTLNQAIAGHVEWMTSRGLGHSQLEEFARVMRWMLEQVGEDRLLASISKEQLRGFRDDICRLTTKMQGKSSSFQQRLTKDPERRIKSDTAIRYWNYAKTLFSHATEEGLIPSDPAAGLNIARRKGEQKRTPEPFSQGELQHLFVTPLFAGCHSVHRPRQPGDCHRRDGRWWSVVLLMHTGLRAGELAQLVPEDFDFSDPIPHLKVRLEDGSGKRVKTTKNDASVRDIPILPQLIKLGLREFVNARAKAKTARVFVEFRLGEGRSSDGMTKFWTPYLRAFGLWKEGRATHVWRHTVAANLRSHGVADEDIGALFGHSPQTVTGGYGGAHPLSRKLKTVKQLDYGFDVVAALGGPYQKALHG
ncbi:integrase [Polymorphobacter multimanifer]|uniref:Integrase n=2 Tax=Polymorphobacter multimanifer TaxID=1070431 RepID=A0A841LJX2_9SPHN|nr:tyrosine-type recombinase/integrase [Polymorphobacter multimanifer]MBB6229532.1 integrase [Polymorphobacter multimanifer]